MKYAHLTKAQEKTLRTALAKVEVSQLQELQSYIRGLIQVATITPTRERKR